MNAHASVKPAPVKADETDARALDPDAFRTEGRRLPEEAPPRGGHAPAAAEDEAAPRDGRGRLAGLGMALLQHGATALALYTWVRLAQRVPVRVHLVSVPPGVPLVAGMTATVSVLEHPAVDAGPTWSVERATSRLREAFDAVVSGPVARPGCIPPVGRETGETVALPIEDKPSPPMPARAVKPDLAPAMITPPRR